MQKTLYEIIYEMFFDFTRSNKNRFNLVKRYKEYILHDKLNPLKQKKAVNLRQKGQQLGAVLNLKSNGFIKVAQLFAN